VKSRVSSVQLVEHPSSSPHGVWYSDPSIYRRKCGLYVEEISPLQRKHVSRRSVGEISGIEMNACVVAVVSQVAVLVDVEAVLGCYAAVEALQTHLHRYVAASLRTHH